MERLLFTLVTGLKMALLAQAPIFLLSLVIGLTWGASRIEPGFEAVGRWLWSCGLLCGAPLAVVGFLVGAVPGESLQEEEGVSDALAG
jgi:hypothetical protein